MHVNAASPSPFGFSRNLAIPMHGEDVSALQQLLIEKGYLSLPEPTGYFGKMTFTAVQNWQKDVSLPQSGFFGPLSRALIQANSHVSLNTPSKVPYRGSSSWASRLMATVYFTQSPACPTAIPTDSFLGCYYDNSDLTGFIGSGIENTINFNFGTSSPDTSIGEDTFSARWEGDFTFLAGAYTFSVVGDDGVRLYVDNKLVINKWIPQYPTTYSKTLNMTDGVHRIKLEYYDKTGGAVAKLSWAQIDTPTPITPSQVPSIPPSIPTPTPPPIPSIPVPIPTPTPILPIPIIPIPDPIIPVPIPLPLPVPTIPIPTPPATTSVPVIQGKFINGQRIKTTANVKVRGLGSILGNLVNTENTGVLGTVIGGPVSQNGYTWWNVTYDSGASGWSAENFLISKGIDANTNPSYGFSVANYLLLLDSVHMDQELAGMESLGVSWLRFDMQWRSVQYKTDPTFFDWIAIDRLVAAAATHHIKIVGILGFAPTWAYTSTCPKNIHCPPADPNAFATFAKAAVERYSPQGVATWEIWNEPNNAVFWGPKTDCSAYTDLLKLAYTTIKQADPNATVITGGLAPEPTDGTNMAPVDFLNCIYANGGQNYFDAVGDHPYTFPIVPSSPFSHAWAQMSTTNSSLRSIMVNNGDTAKKIWMTEFGAPTSGPDSRWYVSEDKQSKMIIDAVNLYKTYDWAGPLFFYTFRDLGVSTWTMENFFGITRFDGSFKPAYSTLKDIISGR